MSFELPKDLKIYAIKKICIRALICLALLVSFVLIVINYGEELFSSYELLYNNKEFFCIIVCMLICYICGVPMKLLDRTFFGTVEKVTVISGYNSKAMGQRQSILNSRTASFRGFKAINTVVLTIRMANGKTINRQVYSEYIGNQTNYDDIFKNGDEVFHLFGSKHYVKLPEDKEQKVICPVCGSQNSQQNSFCESCKHSLIVK
jgi:hypothetical protein